MSHSNNANKNTELTIEEILSSIRNVISSHKVVDDPEIYCNNDDTLELTQEYGASSNNISNQEKGEVISCEYKYKSPETQNYNATSTSDASTAYEESTHNKAEKLISDNVETEVLSMLKELVTQLKQNEIKTQTNSMSHKTLEEFVIEIIKQELKEWMNQNIAPMVHNIITQEVIRITSANKNN